MASAAAASRAAGMTGQLQKINMVAKAWAVIGSILRTGVRYFGRDFTSQNTHYAFIALNVV